MNLRDCILAAYAAKIELEAASKVRRITVRRMTGKARTTSIGSQIVDCLLGKAYGHLAGFPAILENESGAG
jgi:hypothetical protein